VTAIKPVALRNQLDLKPLGSAWGSNFVAALSALYGYKTSKMSLKYSS